VIKRTIEISTEPACLTVQLDQLLIRRGSDLVGSIPCEDIGVVLVDHPQTTYSHAALTRLAEFGAALVVCGNDHLPIAMLLPLADHCQVVWRLHEQLAASKPLCKQLWKQLIHAKILAQARNISQDVPARLKLMNLARNVRSGDPGNVEAHAARVYWRNWIPEKEAFRRDSESDGLNALLNYGYAVLRAAVARAVVAAGMLPSLGLNHRHRANAFCLADDLMEPLRPLVDFRVRDLLSRGHRTVEPDSKAQLLRLLAENVRLGKETGPLMVSLHRFVASLGKCFRGEAKRLEIPVALGSKPSTNHDFSDASDNLGIR
jgi:CRISPR-associated protein Cas1